MQVAQQKLGRFDGSVTPLGPVECGGGLGQGSDDQRVPFHQHLVVEAWLGSRPTNLQQAGAHLGVVLRRDGDHQVPTR